MKPELQPRQKDLKAQWSRVYRRSGDLQGLMQLTRSGTVHWIVRARVVIGNGTSSLETKRNFDADKSSSNYEWTAKAYTRVMDFNDSMMRELWVRKRCTKKHEKIGENWEMIHDTIRLSFQKIFLSPRKHAQAASKTSRVLNSDSLVRKVKNLKENQLITPIRTGIEHHSPLKGSGFELVSGQVCSNIFCH